jgi:hypothetical protein
MHDTRTFAETRSKQRLRSEWCPFNGTHIYGKSVERAVACFAETLGDCTVTWLMKNEIVKTYKDATKRIAF